MTVLADFRVPAEEFVLAETLAASPDTRVEIKRVVGTDKHVTPYFWASGADFEAFEAALRGDDMVREVRTLDEQEGREGIRDDDEDRFYRVTWISETPNLITVASEVGGTVLEANTADGEWEVKVLFPDDAALSEFHSCCVERDLSHEPTRVYRPENPGETGQYGVTGEQLEALEAAYHEGFYNVPRDLTLAELAETLDISRNALSARLRRGTRNLLASTLVHEE